jgi:hypothetical protein
MGFRATVPVLQKRVTGARSATDTKNVLRESYLAKWRWEGGFAPPLRLYPFCI